MGVPSKVETRHLLPVFFLSFVVSISFSVYSEPLW
jgi:hypothetical protein